MFKTLYILRHAKAETGAAGQEDHERTLAPRGTQAATVMGQHLAKQSLRPDLVWCSGSLRTRQTLEKIQDAYKPKLTSEIRERLYNASAGEMLTMIASAPAEVQSLMLIGHNPGMHQLCLKLGKTGDDVLLDTMALKFPTAAFAAINFKADSWRDLVHSRGELLTFITPQMLGVEED